MMTSALAGLRRFVFLVTLALLGQSALLAAPQSPNLWEPQATQGILDTYAVILADPGLLQQEGPKVILAAPWYRIVRTELSQSHLSPVVNDPVRQSWAVVLAGGSFFVGVGGASDGLLGDVTSIASTEGYVGESWQYYGTKRGDAEVNGDLRASGVARIVDPAGGAAIIGACVYESSVLKKELAMTDSVGESTGGMIGELELAVGDFKIKVILPAPGSTVEFPANKATAFGGYAQTSFFRVDHNCGAKVKVAADGIPPLGFAKSEAMGIGYVKSANRLGDY